MKWRTNMREFLQTEKVVCQFIQLFHLMNKMQMEGLYTFNSQQLQELIKRPSSTDNPPNIRKRIITSNFSKKQSLLSQASTREDLLTHSREKQPNSNKKVTFLMDSPLFYDQAIMPRPPSHLMKTRSLAEQNIKDKYIEDIFDRKFIIDRYALPELQKQNKQIQCDKPENKQKKLPIEENMETKENRQNITSGSVRQKRTLSLKLNPKIVPISDRRLPKAFKIKFTPSNVSKQAKMMTVDQSFKDQAVEKKKQFTEDCNQSKILKHSRFEQMFLRENKKFGSFYRPEL